MPTKCIACCVSRNKQTNKQTMKRTKYKHSHTVTHTWSLPQIAASVEFHRVKPRTQSVLFPNGIAACLVSCFKFFEFAMHWMRSRPHSLSSANINYYNLIINCNFLSCTGKGAWLRIIVSENAPRGWHGSVL